MEIWNDVGSPIVAAANVEASGTVEFDLEWVRLKAELVLSSPPPASDPSVSCWAVGNLVPRESPQE